MLSFNPIQLSDKKAFDKIVKPLNSPLCAHCFADLFIWRYTYDNQILIKDDFVFIKQRNGLSTFYSFPLGNGDIKNAIETLKHDALERNVPFVLGGINEQQFNQLNEAFPNKFEYSEQRDNEDYIYDSESLITLSGKKLHSKRNFVNRFKSENDGRWNYENITKENIHEVFDFHLSWCDSDSNESKKDLSNETCAISLAFKNFDELEFKGGLLRLDGKIIAFTIGSRANEDMFVVHIEKADRNIQGSYQMINNQFAINNFEGIKYINREEDLGKEGLRKAKLSYYPAMMGKNYSAKLK